MPERVLLFNPPSARGSTTNREGAGGLGVLLPQGGGFVYPALYLAQMAAGLRERGCEVEAIDRVVAPRRGWRENSRIARATLVAVRASRASFELDEAFARRLSHRYPQTRVVLLVPGGGRNSEAVEVLDAPHGFGAAAQLLGVESDEDPERWPFPDWSGLPLGRSRRLGMNHSWGCTQLCAYCPYVIPLGRRLLTRSAARTAEEWSWQLDRHHPRRIVFRDPSFGLDREGSLELCERIAAFPKRRRVPFEIETRADLLDRPLTQALAAAGCVEIKLGVESLETAPLLASGRVSSESEAKNYREAVDALISRSEDLGIALRIFLLSGLPSATLQGDAVSDAHFEGRPLVYRKPLLNYPGGEAES